MKKCCAECLSLNPAEYAFMVLGHINSEEGISFFPSKEHAILDILAFNNGKSWTCFLEYIL